MIVQITFGLRSKERERGECTDSIVGAYLVMNTAYVIFFPDNPIFIDAHRPSSSQTGLMARNTIDNNRFSILGHTLAA